MTTTLKHAGSFTNSTNDRFAKHAPRALRDGLRLLDTVAPPLAERAAAWLFCHPGHARPRPHEAAVLGSGRRCDLPTGGHRLRGWTWGEGPTVLLHHGWGGHAGQMTAFVAPLVATGHRVVVYDAPAHGTSPGQITSGPEMADHLRDVAAGLGGLHAVVAHSLGSAVTLLAVRHGLRLERAALLAPPADIRHFIRMFAAGLGLSPRLTVRMKRRTAAWYDISWDDMCVEAWAGESQPPLLLVHDRRDPVVGWANGERIAAVWQDAELVTTEGLGHSRIRRDPAVVARVTDFVAQGAREAVADWRRG